MITSVPATDTPGAPTPSSPPVAEEELEVVSGRQFLQGPPEEDAVPLPQVRVRVRRTIEEATSTAEAAFPVGVGSSRERASAPRRLASLP